MKIVSLAMMSAAVLATVGCDKSNSDNRYPVTDRKFSIHASIAAEKSVSDTSRAPQLDETGSGNFVDGDRFTLHALTPSGQRTVLEYEVGSEGLYWRDLKMDPSDMSADFAACYPPQEPVDGTFRFDLGTASDKDLLWARRTNVPVGVEGSVELTFEHAMHTLVINFTGDSSLASEQIVSTCTAKSACTVNLETRTLLAEDSPKTDFTASGSKATFLLVPQKCSDVSLKVTAGKAETEFKLSDKVKDFESLESGKILTLNLEIKDGSIRFNGCTISGWGNQGTVEGEIIM